ncbi:neuritin-like [Chroicocephalus ridibundus]|uniref:neuritin-like n=1 Tax=Chroicocephalus ridibundus TaxID=1192867 RepID=UPI002FDDCC9D
MVVRAAVAEPNAGVKRCRDGSSLGHGRAAPVPGYWDEFHTCALTALWECQKEAVAIWEMLRRESQKIKFQGSLFDLCSPSMTQSFAWTHVPNVSILGIPLIVAWLNL